jgi:hypothetical protein
MDFVSLVSNFLGVVKEWFGFQSKKLDLKNTAPMEAAKAAQVERDAVDKTNTAIAKGDANELEKELAE